MGYKYPWIGVLIFCATYIALASGPAHAATLRLSWQDNSSNETGFKIERMNGATYVQIASVAANVASYSDSNLTAGSTYCYRVRAFNAAGASAPTNAACTTAPTSSTSPSTGTTSPTPTSPPPTSTSTPTAPTTPNWTDYLVSLKMRSADNDALGVMFRYQDDRNYYRFSWFAQGKNRRLEKRVNGVFSIIAQDAVAYTSGQTYALQISARGSALTVAVDGKTIFNVTDTSLSKGTIGLYAYHNTGSYFDDVHVQDYSGSTLLAADFNDGKFVGWSIINNGTVEGPSVWSVINGAFAQTGNLGSAGDDIGRLGTYALYTRGSWADYRFTAKLRSSDDDFIGVMFRVQDSNNYYRLMWERGTPGRRLWKRENGVFKLLAEDAVAYIPNQTYAVEVIAQGNSLKVNINGKAVFSLTDQSFPVGAVALYSSYNQGSYFDDVLVEDLITETVLLWDDFNDGNVAGWKAFDESGTNSGPSKWSVTNGAVVQSTNIGSDATGKPGTFLLY
ncbi:MAG: family 16 glycoside hydrolase [Candidatus Binatia bacterium]